MSQEDGLSGVFGFSEKSEDYALILSIEKF
jgi:hypothetical protein